MTKSSRLHPRFAPALAYYAKLTPQKVEALFVEAVEMLRGLPPAERADGAAYWMGLLVDFHGQMRNLRNGRAAVDLATLLQREGTAAMLDSAAEIFGYALPEPMTTFPAPVMMKHFQRWYQDFTACEEVPEPAETITLMLYRNLSAVAPDMPEDELRRHCRWGVAEVVYRQSRISGISYRKAAEAFARAVAEGFDSLPLLVRALVEAAKPDGAKVSAATIRVWYMDLCRDGIDPDNFPPDKEWFSDEEIAAVNRKWGLRGPTTAGGVNKMMRRSGVKGRPRRR